MKPTLRHAARLALPLALAASSCQNAVTPEAKGAARDVPAAAAPAAPVSSEAGALEAMTGSDPWSGVIAETMNSGGYTYVLLDSGSSKRWCAGPEVDGLAVGQEVSIVEPMEMQDFTSATLGRTFPVIYFTAGIQSGSAGAANPHGSMLAAPDPHASIGDPHAFAGATGEASAPVAKIEGGYSVEEVFAKKAELDGKTVKVRGRVAKFMANIMGTNWLHIEDGTGSGDTARLRVKTSASPAVGTLVVVEGKVAADQNLGAGYSYEALIEDATVTEE